MMRSLRRWWRRRRGVRAMLSHTETRITREGRERHFVTYELIDGRYGFEEWEIISHVRRLRP